MNVQGHIHVFTSEPINPNCGTSKAGVCYLSSQLEGAVHCNLPVSLTSAELCGVWLGLKVDNPRRLVILTCSRSAILLLADASSSYLLARVVADNFREEEEVDQYLSSVDTSTWRHPRKREKGCYLVKDPSARKLFFLPRYMLRSRDS